MSNNTNHTIRELTSYEDIENVILNYKDNYFLRAITKDEYRKIFIDKHIRGGHFLAEYHNDVPVGFLSFYSNDLTTKKAFITAFALSDSLGFLKGKTLYRLFHYSLDIVLAAGMETVGLEVEKDNEKGIRLYNHMGFKELPADEQPESNSGAKNTIFMELPLKDAHM